MNVKCRGTGWLWLFCLAVSIRAIAAGAMDAGGGTASLPAPVPAGNKETITIGKLLAAPGEFADREIRIAGAFHGWKGSCAASSPQTRSDWILKDETGCIYVSGRIPAGVSPVAPRGEMLIVSGTLKIKERGKPHFRAGEIRFRE